MEAPWTSNNVMNRRKEEMNNDKGCTENNLFIAILKQKKTVKKTVKRTVKRTVR